MAFWLTLFVSYRTILKSPRAVIGKKTFHHFSLIEGLKRKLNKGIDGDEILIKIGVDGVSSAFKSIKYEIWPILCRVINSNDKRPFVVSLNVDEGKPVSVDNFMKPFVEV